MGIRFHFCLLVYQSIHIVCVLHIYVVHVVIYIPLAAYLPPRSRPPGPPCGRRLTLFLFTSLLGIHTYVVRIVYIYMLKYTYLWQHVFLFAVDDPVHPVVGSRFHFCSIVYYVYICRSACSYTYMYLPLAACLPLRSRPPGPPCGSRFTFFLFTSLLGIQTYGIRIVYIYIYIYIICFYIYTFGSMSSSSQYTTRSTLW